MFRSICCSLTFVCFLALQASHAQDTTLLPTDDPPSIVLSNETANNTSACFASGSPSYCTKALPNLPTSSANQSAGAETTTVDAFPEHISTISLHRLMYPTWNGQLICEYQPWFSTDSSTNFNGHVNIGYNENNQGPVANQDTTMISRGCNINWIDFYGQKDSSTQFNLTTTNNVYSDLAGRYKNSQYPLKFAILEDENAFKTDCTPSGQTESGAMTCIEDALEADMKYINNNYASASPHPTLYWTDQGTNVVGFFGACADFVVNSKPILSCPSDWDTIWTTVQNYTNSNTYNMKFVFEFGNFDIPTISAGEYAWPQPYTDPSDTDSFIDNTPSQYWWCDGTGITCTGKSGGYLDQFYIQGSQNSSSHLTIGLLYSGFDDSNASWTKGRVIGQQCGHVLLDSANEVTKGGYWGTGTNQIPYMQMATWNDYEEGTEEESGVDNCYTGVNLSLVSGTTKVSWALTTNGDPNAKTDTIHHFALWTAPHGQTSLTLRAQPSHTSTQYDMSTLKLTPGSYDVYVEMVGQPSTQNEMSNTVEYTQP